MLLLEVSQFMEYMHECLNYDKQLPAKIVIHTPTGYYEMPEHWHRSLEITYMIEPVIVLLNGEQRRMENEIFLVNSGDIHRVVSVNTRQVNAVTVMVSYELLTSLVPDYDRYTFNLKKNSRKLKDLEDVFRAIYCVYTENGGVYQYLKVNELLYRLLYLLFSYFKEEKDVSGQIGSEKYFTRLKTIMEYMCEQYKQPLKQEEIAAYFGWSKEHLSRCFKKYTGTTCMGYLEHIRLKEAYFQLMKEDCSMLDIALDNGFADVRSFTNAFKKVYGTTPFQYKKNVADSKN